MNRRNFLQVAGGAASNAALVGGFGASLLLPAHATQPATRAAAEARQLAFLNTHTGETFRDAYWENGDYVPDAMSAINQVMRDHRSGEVHAIDPRLLDQLHSLKGLVEASAIPNHIRLSLARDQRHAT